MDSGAVQSRVHESDQHHPHSLGSEKGEHYGADDHHHDHDKKSVLKKVKAKAKKIKDTIKKHAHHDYDHDHEYHNIPDDHDLDEEDDEDEDIVENPEVHGAPIYESTVARTVIPAGEQDHHQEPKVVVVSPNMGTDQTVAKDSATRTFAGEEGNAGQRKVNLQRPIDLEEDPATFGTTRHPRAASNYQSKVTDPTGAGAAEIHVTPALKSFAEMNINDKTKPNPELHLRPTTTPCPSVTPTIHEERPRVRSTATAPYPSVNLPRPIELEEDPAAPGTTRQPRTASNYQSKVTDPTGAGAAEIHVTPALHSFAEMNFPDETKTNPEPRVYSTATLFPSVTPTIHEDQKRYESMDKPSNQSGYNAAQYPSGTPIMQEEQKHYESAVDKPSNQSSYTAIQYPSGTSEMHGDQKHNESMDKPSNQSSYTDKISSATSAIADKAITAKNAIASKLSYDDNEGSGDHENEKRSGENQSSYTDKISSATSVIADKAVAAKNAVTSKLGYNDNQGNRDHENGPRHGENQSSYTEKISSATSAIADKAVSAKNAVTSKLGYGGGVGENVTTTQENYPKSEAANASGMSTTSTAEYGKKITESLTEKLAPVYGKVAGVGSAMKSKLSPSTNETDKGLCMKDYFTEKLRPGDEDRALSEVISETLKKRGGEATANERGAQEGRIMTDVISDVIHERDEGVAEAEHRSLGKVTESEEVKRRLGSESDIDSRYQESYENSSGKGVVDKLKDAAVSWFGKSQENQPSQVLAQLPGWCRCRESWPR
ncbi:low-temperature-induced 65 kDa protein-like isoform X2 [Prosopis cineraria]|uniref:low-temperature-induced 65 kDa protein-like isoform X2 n=1 Tax=Prosopis cineraria TaxID=364024 RepID=UPI00240EC77B|nr:low-temperature-induced 65 kDa protein-like isoform X2 [Prosopis cineraria]